MSDNESFDASRDHHLAAELTRCQSALQQSIHAAVEAGLKVSVTVEAIHPGGDRHPEPLVEVSVERVVRLI